MSATGLNKAATASAYPAATGLFEQLAGLFASSSLDYPIKLAPKQLDASLKALRQAPHDELAAVSEILQEISTRIFKLNENAARTNKARARSKSNASVAAEPAKKAQMLHGSPRHANQDPMESELTLEQQRANAEVMSRLRRESAAALQRRIDSKDLLSPKEFQDALGISRQSVNEAVKARRMFALLGPSGENYYPAFYADSELNRREVEKVSKVLGGVPSASRYHFFTSKSMFLGTLTPLQALKKGRLEDVLIAATAYKER
jgi:hypothetical protein